MDYNDGFWCFYRTGCIEGWFGLWQQDVKDVTLQAWRLLSNGRGEGMDLSFHFWKRLWERGQEVGGRGGGEEGGWDGSAC